MKKHLSLAIALACAPFAASAGELSYNYVELGYSESTLKTGSGDFDGDGYAFKGSMGFGDKFYGAIGVHDDSLDSDSLEPWELTGGYRTQLAEGTDFVAELSYIGVNSEVFGDEYHNDGYRAAAGVRSAIGDHVELGGKVTWTDVENMDDVVGANVNIHVKFNQTWGVYGQYHYNEYNFLGADLDNWQIGVRASF